MDQDHGGSDACQEAEKHFYQEKVTGVFHSLKYHGFKGHHRGQN
jgi:hypothetical protein